MEIINVDDCTLKIKPTGKIKKEFIRKTFKDFAGEAVFLDGEWEKNFQEFTMLLELIQKYNLKFGLKLDSCTWEEFRLKFGMYQFEKVNKMKFDEVPVNDVEMLRFIGSVAIDYYLNHTDYNVVYKCEDGYKLAKVDIPR